jgi:hypothetical protein
VPRPLKWAVLQKEYSSLERVDLELFTFELDETIGEVFQLVTTIFGAVSARP